MSGAGVSTGLRLFSLLERGLNYTSALLIMVMMLLITGSVVTRNLLNWPLPGTYETSELLMLGLIFLGMSYVQSRRRHIRVTFVYQMLPRTMRGVADILVLVLSIVFWATFAWESGHRAAQSWEMREFTLGVIEFPLYPAWTVLPVGAGLLTLRLVIDLVQVLARGPEAMDEDQSLASSATEAEAAQ